MITTNTDMFYNYPTVFETQISPMALQPLTVPFYNQINPMALQPITTPFYLLDKMVLPNKVSYLNVNNDPNLRKNMVKYFWKKINYWLNNSKLYKKIYNYMYVVGDKIKFGLDNNPEKTADKIIKYEYIVKDIINKKDLYDIIDKFCKLNNINYWELQDIHIKDKIKKYFYKKIKNVILNQKK